MYKWTKMETKESRKKETILQSIGEIQKDPPYPLRDLTYVYKNETTLNDAQGVCLGRIERWYFKGDRLHEKHSKYRAWLIGSNGDPIQLGLCDGINLTECKSLVEFRLSADDLIRYSFARLGFSPHSLVYTVNMAKYPQITLADVGKWVRDKEKELRGYEGQYMVFNGFSLEFYHHVLKRAGVNHMELVYELNQWANTHLDWDVS